MKANILSINGNKLRDIELPKCFSQKIRGDLIHKVLEAKKKRQPYSPSPIAGNQHSASGKIQHRRHVWKTHYGKGISRIPRKTTSRKGSQFVWIGATIPSAVGGRRAHPPKVASMINTKKINKKEMEIALNSAISATANKKEIVKRYENLKTEDLKNFNLPIIVEGKIASLKTKPLIESLKKILGEKVFDSLSKKKKIRSGKGKLRGRKYKKNKGLILVIGKDEKLNVKSVETINASNLSVNNLAEGSPGRIAIYSEKAISELNEKKVDKKWIQ